MPSSTRATVPKKKNRGDDDQSTYSGDYISGFFSSSTSRSRDHGPMSDEDDGTSSAGSNTSRGRMSTPTAKHRRSRARSPTNRNSPAPVLPIRSRSPGGRTRPAPLSTDQRVQPPPMRCPDTPAAMERVPALVWDLNNARNTSGERAARALRALFGLSERGSSRSGAPLTIAGTNSGSVMSVSSGKDEHGEQYRVENRNRVDMVKCADGGLVPALLDFLGRCKRGSSEQYLALLVLNNVSIPGENKRVS